MKRVSEVGTHCSNTAAKWLPCILGEFVKIFVEHPLRFEGQRVFENRWVKVCFCEKTVDEFSLVYWILPYQQSVFRNTD